MTESRNELCECGHSRGSHASRTEACRVCYCPEFVLNEEEQ